MKHWIIFINERGNRVTLDTEITNFKEEKKWNNTVNRMKRSDKITYIGSGKYDY